MKFSIALNMTRFDASQPMRDVIDNTLELVKLADQGGFEIAWAAESNFGLDHKTALRSLELFISDVMPHF